MPPRYPATILLPQLLIKIAKAAGEVVTARRAGSTRGDGWQGLLCEIPKGTEGRPSMSLTLDQAEAVLKASEGTALT
jgi:hypothetical protein